MSNLEPPAALRLDQYVVQQLPAISRASGAKLIERGQVLVNGQAQTKASYRLKTTDVVTIEHDEAVHNQIDELQLPIIYEDKSCVVINKPAGVLSHSKGAFNPEATVATWLADKLTDMTGERAGIVHRLDRATSGVMICAKTSEALSWLQKQFSQRRVKKTYVAVVKGTPDKVRAIIDMPIERNPKKPQTFRVGANGKSATTEYRIMASSERYSLLELKPTTGRTHQLRVHLQQLGHPIVGDVLYGGEPAERLFLHAYQLELTLPSKIRRTFSVVVPPEFERLIEQ